MKIHTDIPNWVYKYDYKARVWRALHIQQKIEINQYHKEELAFLIDHFDDEHTWNTTMQSQVPFLTKEEASAFWY